MWSRTGVGIPVETLQRARGSCTDVASYPHEQARKSVIRDGEAHEESWYVFAIPSRAELAPSRVVTPMEVVDECSRAWTRERHGSGRSRGGTTATR